MSQVSHRKLKSEIQDKLVGVLIEVISATNTTKSGLLFTHNFLSSPERIMLAKRVGIALLIKQGYTYESVMEYIKVSKGTVAKVAEIIKHADKQSQAILNKIIMNKNIAKVFSEIDYIVGRIYPPKGRDRSSWRKNLESTKRKSENPV